MKPERLTPLLWSVRISSALGLLSLSLSGEISTPYLALSWLCWISGFAFDRFPEREQILRRFETPAAVSLVGLFLFDFFLRKETIFIAVAHFLLIFQNFKWVGEKKRKDCLQILFFSFFQILSACTLSLAVWHALILLVMIPAATAALFWHQVAFQQEQSGQPFPEAAARPYRRLVTLMCAAVLPMNIVLTAAVFILFPRLNWNVTISGLDAGSIGFTDQVNLARTGSLRPDNSIVLWLDIHGAGPKSWDGYLRGATMDFFDGRQWSAKMNGGRVIQPDHNGVFIIHPATHHRPIWQASVLLIKASSATLFHSGRVLRIVAPLTGIHEDLSGCFHWMGGWNRPLRYELASEAGPVPPDIASVDLQPYLQLPATATKGLSSLAQTLAGHGSDYRQASTIAQYLQTHYTYTLNLASEAAANPVEDFLLIHKQGPCGYFASAMAVLLRLRGIPCRVVAGYLRGEWNDQARQYLIREKDAHAWVEVYIQGSGWVTFDPSPFIPPVPAVRRSQRLLQKLDQYWDFLNLEWERVIIQYDLYSQLRELEKLQHTSERLNDWIADRWLNPGESRRPHSSAPTTPAAPFPWTLLSKGAAALGLLIAVVWISYRTRETLLEADPDIRLYHQFLRQMERAGIAKHPAETGQEFAGRLSRTRPEETSRALVITQRYYAARFE